MTRQNEIYIFGLMIIFFLHKFGKDRKKAILITLNSTILIILWITFSFVKYNNYAIITDSSGQSLGGASLMNDILALVIRLPQTILIELFQLLIRDTGIFLLIIIAIIIIFPLKKITMLQQFFLWMLFSGILLTSVNGSLGSGFRYAMPSIFVSAFSVLEFWNKQRV